MISQEEFINTMMTPPLTEYGEEVIAKFRELTPEQQQECLDQRRVKDICCEVERLYDLNRLPDFKNDVEWSDMVIFNCDAFSWLDRDVWMVMDEIEKKAVLTDAEEGFPIEREGKEIWFNVMGILYSLTVAGDEYDE